jgi:lysophospholipase L1-like esterase
MLKKLPTLLLLLIAGTINLNCHSPKIKAPQWIQQHRAKRLTQFKQENQQLDQQNYIILLGNSITEGFSVATYFSDLPVLNRGIVADHTGIEGNGILQRLKQSVFDCRASKIFLMIGINDLADKIFTPKQIAYGVKLIVQKIHRFDPKIQIYLQSALPTSGKYAYLNAMVLEFNQNLQQVAAELTIHYLDLHSRFTDETGELQTRYSRDGLHLNDEAYKIWKALILPYFE